MALDSILLALAAIAYTASAGSAAFMFLRGSNASLRRIQITFGVAMIPHALAVVARAVDLGAFPIASVHDGLAAFGLLAALFAIGIATRGGVPQVTAVAAPLLAGVTILAVLVPPTQAVPEALRSAWLGVHIALALMGDAAFAVAGVVAILYLVQERRLKNKTLPTRNTATRGNAEGPRGRGNAEGPRGRGNTGNINTLPALDILDRVSVRLIQIGFPLMTLGLLTGSLYGKQVWGVYWSWDPRNTISLLVWVLYALMIHARWMIGWRGRKAAILTVVGVIAILIAFVGLGLAGVGTHGKDYS